MKGKLHKTGNETILGMVEYSNQIEKGKQVRPGPKKTLITTLYLLGMMEIVSPGQEPSMYKNQEE
jgi:hypothetical protein